MEEIMLVWKNHIILTAHIVVVMSKFWTEDRKQRVVDYISGMIFGYCIGMIVGVWILWKKNLKWYGTILLKWKKVCGIYS